jgi:DnaJ-class molecular chaperone
MKPAEIADLYERLELKQDASQEEIKSAFRLQAHQWHPDVSGLENAMDAGEQFIAVAEAYEVLSDPAKRWLYDGTGAVESFRAQASSREPQADFVAIARIFSYYVHDYGALLGDVLMAAHGSKEHIRRLLDTLLEIDDTASAADLLLKVR